MLSRNLFKKAVEAMEEEDKKFDSVSDCLEKIVDGYVVFEEFPCKRYILEMLQQTSDDKNDYISWYLYEDVEKVLYGKDDKIVYHVDTLDDLYDLLAIETEEEGWIISEKLSSMFNKDAGDIYLENNGIEFSREYWLSKDMNEKDRINLTYLFDVIEQNKAGN